MPKRKPVKLFLTDHLQLDKKTEKELDERGDRIIVTWEARCYMPGCKRPARWLEDGVFFCKDHEVPFQRKML